MPSSHPCRLIAALTLLVTTSCGGDAAAPIEATAGDPPAPAIEATADDPPAAGAREEPAPNGGSPGAVPDPPEGRIDDPCRTLTPTIRGDDGDNHLVGTAGRDIIFGEGGNDTIEGLGGDDVICGGGGADLIDGGAGDDYIDGGYGNDTIHGGPGNDTLHGRFGGDHVYGDSGNDFVFGDVLDDHLYGGDGDDLVVGGHGTDEIHGGPGNDWLRGDTNVDHFYGEAGIDTVSLATAAPPGQPSPNGVLVDFVAGAWVASGDGLGETLSSIEVLIGSSFDDRLVAAPGVRRLVGGYGDDSFTAGAAVEIDDGPGADLCNDHPCDDSGEQPPRPAGPFAFIDHRPRDIGLVVMGSKGQVDDVLVITMAGSAARVTAADGAAITAGPGCVHPDETRAAVVECTPPGTLRWVLAYGDAGNDRITMGNGFPRDMTAHLYGGDGDDHLVGGDGEDVLFTGMTGLDVLEGNEGDDALISESSPSDQRVPASEHVGGADILKAGPGNDQLVSDYPCGGHSFSGGTGRDVAGFARSAGFGIHAQLAGPAENHQPFFGKAYCPALCPLAQATVLVDDQEILEGAKGDDLLVGNDLDNVIWGRGGDDKLLGLGGDDRIEGHDGNDQIYGGPGRDWMRGGAGFDLLYAGDREADREIDCGGGRVESVDGNLDPSPVGCK